MKRILVGFLIDGQIGGTDVYIMNFIKTVWNQEIQIDVLTNKKNSVLIQNLEPYQAKVYEIANLKHPKKQYRDVKDIIRRGSYDVVYLNISTAIDCIAAKAAKDCGISRIMLHCHSSGIDIENRAKRMIFHICNCVGKQFLYRWGTEYYGCSKAAGYWVFPKNVVDSKQFQVIYNAVDRQRFAYRPSVREALRKEWKLEHKLVLGHVGSFQYVKNQEYVLEVFDVVQKNFPESVLLFVGEGNRQQFVRNLARKLGIEHKIYFLGWREDTDRLLQMMDFFLLPSHFEGLPIAGVEAQCTKLCCLMSDTITEEARINSKCQFLSIGESPKVWAEAIMKEKGYKREEVALLESIWHYDLKAMKLQLKDLLEVEHAEG